MTLDQKQIFLTGVTLGNGCFLHAERHIHWAERHEGETILRALVPVVFVDHAARH